MSLQYQKTSACNLTTSIEFLKDNEWEDKTSTIYEWGSPGQKKFQTKNETVSKIPVLNHSII
jgi:hypothetical protein